MDGECEESVTCTRDVYGARKSDLSGGKEWAAIMNVSMRGSLDGLDRKSQTAG